MNSEFDKCGACDTNSEACFFNFMHCYKDGLRIEGLPFISICSNISCCKDDIYCSKDTAVCLNRWRDICFRTQYYYETDTTYYPSDCEITGWKDRRWLKLREVPRKPYYYSGNDMIALLDDAMLFVEVHGTDLENLALDQSYDMVMDDLRHAGYNISIRQFKKILNTYFPVYFLSKFGKPYGV